MKHINFEISDGVGIDLDKSNLSDGNISFKKKKETPLVLSNEECLPFLPEVCYYSSSNGSIIECIGDVRIDINTITSIEYAEAFLALMQLIKFRDIWNGGWKPDWEDGTIKYIIYFYNNKKRVGGGGWLFGGIDFQNPRIKR
jgi:hypothetical protein